MNITYYDIGLNLFTRSFPDPEKIIADAEADGICCILTGSEDRENRLVDDYDRMFSKKENQLYFFKKLIALAEELDKPMFLHERDAGDDFLACFKGHEGVCPKSVVHCYTGDKETLARMLDMGFYIGITGWICDERRADALREAVSILPLDRVLLETDAPYLTPRGFHLPRTNVPNNITYVASTLAKYMDVSVEALTVQAKANTERLFRL